ncbi:MAG: ribonuclease III [Patescibacteria group bacterium]
MTTIDFEKVIGIEFKNKDLLNNVFIHRSYLNEHRSLQLEHNERLEFLGDAVLELCVTQYLFNKFSDKPEGVMTNWRSALVKGESLSAEAKRLGLNDLIKTSRGEAKNVGKARDLILANAFEALIGAIYLDQGYEIAYKFIEKNIIYKLAEIINQGLYYDSKSKFQELAQDVLSITPSYTTVSENGPDHAKVFVVGAFLGDKKVAEGSGNSKQKAQSEAAKAALQKWDDICKQ